MGQWPRGHPADVEGGRAGASRVRLVSIRALTRSGASGGIRASPPRLASRSLPDGSKNLSNQLGIVPDTLPRDRRDHRPDRRKDARRFCPQEQPDRSGHAEPRSEGGAPALPIVEAHRLDAQLARELEYRGLTAVESRLSEGIHRAGEWQHAHPRRDHRGMTALHARVELVAHLLRHQELDRQLLGDPQRLAPRGPVLTTIRSLIVARMPARLQRLPVGGSLLGNQAATPRRESPPARDHTVATPAPPSIDPGSTIVQPVGAGPRPRILTVTRRALEADRLRTQWSARAA